MESENNDNIDDRSNLFNLMFHKTDKHDEEKCNYDTDVDITSDAYDDDGDREQYMKECRRIESIPTSYYLRHMNDRFLSMTHHGLCNRESKALADSLAINENIIKLDISDNNITDVGGCYIMSMLSSNSTLTELNLSNNNLAIQSIATLVTSLKNNHTLTHLNLSGNQLNDNCFDNLSRIIESTLTLEWLDLSNNGLSEQTALKIGPAIGENTSLKFLNLSWNIFTSKKCVSIIDGLRENIALREIDLKWNGFTQSILKNLSKCFIENSTLEIIDLSNNNIDFDCYPLLVKLFSVNEALKTVKFAHNKFSSANCESICKGIMNNKLSILTLIDLSNVSVDDSFRLLKIHMKFTNPNLEIRTNNQQRQIDQPFVVGSGNIYELVGKYIESYLISHPLKANQLYETIRKKNLLGKLISDQEIDQNGIFTANERLKIKNRPLSLSQLCSLSSNNLFPLMKNIDLNLNQKELEMFVKDYQECGDELLDYIINVSDDSINFPTSNISSTTNGKKGGNSSETHKTKKKRKK
ncbi:hypothetical protein SNEBB_006095 [Seison nebaliae]|nr:hypothetical protein SNEBB_006095 [Seison nebaliae]